MFIEEIDVTWHDYRVATLPHYVHDTTDICLGSIVPSKKKTPRVFTKTYQVEQRALSINVIANADAKNDKDLYKKAIFDTGAMSVCVKRGLPELYGWTKIGTAKIGGAVGSADADVCVGGLTLRFDGCSELPIFNIPMIEAPLPGDVDFLIGQPIIKRFKFTVDNFKSLEISV